MLGAISCGEPPQTEASYARSYLLAVMLGHHSDNGIPRPGPAVLGAMFWQSRSGHHSAEASTC